MAVFKTNDGVSLYYEVKGEGKPLLMLPGWTCTTRFFDHNSDVLAKDCQVILMDFRGHGESEKTLTSHRIARYAMDVKNLLDHLDVEDVTVLGWSMGAAILWSYLELFGKHRVGKLVCVDQAPLQYTGPDWVWGQNGCYDGRCLFDLCAIEFALREKCRRFRVIGCLIMSTEEEGTTLADEIFTCLPRSYRNLGGHTESWFGGISFRKSYSHPGLCRPQGKVFIGREVPGLERIFQGQK